MKKFLELQEASNTVAFTFGRFNPPTIGHEKLCDAVKKANPSDYKIFASHTQNPKKDPLQYAKKIAYMKQSFPKHKNSIIVSKSREIFQILVELNSYENLIMVVGSDRVAEFKRIINEYNGVKARHGFYEYKTVQVLSAGERDPDAEGATGMSASKMRAAAVDSDFNSFKLGTPLNDVQSKKLYFDVRKSMGIREELDMNDPETLRDLYLSEQIWNVGELVRVNDNPYEIIRKGTNYITVIDETYKTHKFWLHEISMYEMSGTALKKISQDFKSKSTDILHGREFAFLSGLMKTINHRQLAKDLKGFLLRHKQIKDDVLKILAKYLQPFEVKTLTEVKQDKEVKDKEGTQPAKYYAGDMAKSTKDKRDAHFKKKKDGPAPGDSTVKTKPSVHTKKFNQMFGERDYKDEYKKFQSSPERIKYRAELVKYNRDKGTYGNGDNKDASHKDGKIVGFEAQSKNRGKAESSRLKGSKRKTIEACWDNYKQVGTKKKGGKVVPNCVPKSEMKEEFNFYPKDLQDYIQIPPPPTDDTRELETIRKILSTRTEQDIEDVANNDKDAFYSIKEYMKDIGIKFHDDELNDIVQQAVPTIRHFKDKFNRSRPFELDGNLDVLGSTTNKTPSYPSGHSCQSMLVALYVARKSPEHRDGLIEAAKKVGLGRVKAGFHFLSDHVAGQMLGQKMFEHMNKEDYGQSLKEYYLMGTPEYDGYLKKLTPGESKMNEWDELDEDAEYQGKKVKLNNPVRGGSKKFYVYVKNDKGNVIKVSFGDTTGLSIKRDSPERRKAFRARHNCDQKTDKTTAGYWSCKFWEKGKSVTDLMKG